MGIFARRLKISKREYTLIRCDLQGLEKRIEHCSFLLRGSERGIPTASCLAENICDRAVRIQISNLSLPSLNAWGVRMLIAFSL
jgi:hypothetical protein